MGVRLPAEYQEVEYLEATGTQAFFTDVPIQDGLTVDSIQTFNGGDTYLFGGHNGKGLQASFNGYYASRLQSSYSGYYAWGNVSPDNQTIYHVVLTQKNAEQIGILNGSQVLSGTRTTTGDTSAGDTAAMFGQRGSNGSLGLFYKGKVYSCKVSKGNELLADYVPCYRRQDIKPGMYDLVSKTFYTNQGTGEFLVGPDVVNHISPRLMDRRRALIAKLTSLFRKVITSQTGLVSFGTNVAKPMKVTCEFSPKQDLHGYDNPWPAGGGKNLWDGTFNEYIPAQFASGTQLCLQAVLDDTSKYIVLRTYDSNKTFLQSVATLNISGNINFGLLTLTSDAAYIKIEKSNDITATNGMLSIASTVQTYQPYENICPIEAWDGANVVKAQRNLLNPDDVHIVSLKLDNSLQTRQGVMFQKAGKYCIKAFAHPNNSVYFYAKRYEKNGTWNSDRYIVAASNNYNVEITINDGDKLYLFNALGQSAEATKNIIINFQITCCLDEYAETYEPYHGTTLPITFNNPGTYDFLPIQAGTGDPSPENIRPITPGLTFTRDDTSTLSVYSGTLTVNEDGSGTLVADVIGKRVTSDLGTINFSVDRVRYTVMDTLPVDAVTTISNQRYLCNIFPKVYGSTAPGIVFTQNGDGTNPFILFRGLDSFGITNTLEGWNQFIIDNEVFITYVLATPVTYNLSVAETSRAFEALGLGKNLGPLYGGSVTINEDGSCDVVSKYGYKVYDGTQTPSYFPWGTYGDNDEFVSVLYPPLPLEDDHISYGNHVDLIGCVCNQCIAKTPAGSRIGPNLWSFYSARRSFGPYFMLEKSLIGETQETLNSYLSEHPLAISYPLDIPKTYHFSSIGELQSFLGTNNVWSDLNGPITVEYYKKQQ